MARSNPTDTPRHATNLTDPTTDSGGEPPFSVTMNDDARTVDVTHPAGDAEAGYDLTSFPSPESFQALLDNHHLSGPYGIPRHPDRRHPDTDAGALKGWVWADEYVLVYTAANPLTGVRAGLERPPEPGYASYIGLKGERASVETLYRAIGRRGTYEARNPTACTYIG